MLDLAFSRPVVVANTRSSGSVNRLPCRCTFNNSTNSGFRSAITATGLRLAGLDREATAGQVDRPPAKRGRL
jgi:hypothetical protein